jgi:hypothetical protein
VIGGSLTTRLDTRLQRAELVLAVLGIAWILAVMVRRRQQTVTKLMRFVGPEPLEALRGATDPASLCEELLDALTDAQRNNHSHYEQRIGRVGLSVAALLLGVAVTLVFKIALSLPL